MRSHVNRDRGRIRARPASPAASPTEAEGGMRTILGADGVEREAILYIPTGYCPGTPAPLAVLLHGAGGNAQHGIRLLLPLADTLNLILLAPQSRGVTWDVIHQDYGPDVDRINRQLASLFAAYSVDPQRVVIGGFSDGASYALSLGITNGDLFTHIIAFSPGFLAPAAQVGKPPIFIAHGTGDRTLPIDRCSRRIVPALRQAGYAVDYREFAGPHTVPPTIAEEAARWLFPEAERMAGN